MGSPIRGSPCRDLGRDGENPMQLVSTVQRYLSQLRPALLSPDKLCLLQEIFISGVPLSWNLCHRLTLLHYPAVSRRQVLSLGPEEVPCIPCSLPRGGRTPSPNSTSDTKGLLSALNLAGTWKTQHF
jgi:hypothetical protein